MKPRNRQKAMLTMAAIAMIAATSCTKHYEVASVQRTRIMIDSRYDAQPDEEAHAFLDPFKHTVDSIMGPVVGKTAKPMKAYRPESPLSNLLADILVDAGQYYGEQPVMGLYNMGGIRASLPGGTITYGDVLDVAPFENKICFLTLTGKNLMELFENIAYVGGEGVSHGVELRITKDRKVASVRLHGKEIDPQSEYRIATIDYLAQGNDRMTAFKKKTDYNAPQATENDTRFIIRNYFEKLHSQGTVVDENIEGRIVAE